VPVLSPAAGPVFKMEDSLLSSTDAGRASGAAPALPLAPTTGALPGLAVLVLAVCLAALHSVLVPERGALVVFHDEAHHTTGDANKRFALLTDEAKCPAKKRVSMTALVRSRAVTQGRCQPGLVGVGTPLHFASPAHPDPAIWSLACAGLTSSTMRLSQPRASSRGPAGQLPRRRGVESRGLKLLSEISLKFGQELVVVGSDDAIGEFYPSVPRGTVQDLSRRPARSWRER